MAINRRKFKLTVPRERLMELYDYDPETGAFTHRVSLRTKKAGEVATINSRYLNLRVEHGKVLMAHRVAWLFVHGDWPECEIDHINRDKHDNRIANLRLATGSQNRVNSRPRKSRLGVRGVYPAHSGKFKAMISVDRKQIYLGTYDSIDEASRVHKEALKQVWGEFSP